MKTIVVDLDGVIAEEKDTFERTLAYPVPLAAQSLLWLQEQGYRIIIYTARGWAEYELTKNWLDKFNIPHDELIMGKPIATAYIDDRAIRFTSWADVLEKANAEPKYASNLYLVREHIWMILRDLFIEPKKTVLEIGPMNEHSPFADAFYVDTEAKWKDTCLYYSIDMDPNSDAHIIEDYHNWLPKLKNVKFDVIIAMSVLEHDPKAFEAPEVLYNAMPEGGELHIEVPFNLRFHGPTPDCWRFTDVGLRYMFGKFFEVEKMEMHGDRMTPASIYAKMRRK